MAGVLKYAMIIKNLSTLKLIFYIVQKFTGNLIPEFIILKTAADTAVFLLPKIHCPNPKPKSICQLTFCKISIYFVNI